MIFHGLVAFDSRSVPKSYCLRDEKTGREVQLKMGDHWIMRFFDRPRMLQDHMQDLFRAICAKDCVF